MRELIHPGQLKGHGAVVVGTGSSGRGAARLLARLGAEVRWVDRKEPGEQVRAEAEALGVALVIGDHTPAQFAGADMVVLSPGVNARSLRAALANVPESKVISELELASWFASEPIIAVTGTSGKTTTVSLIGHMLRTAGKRVFVGGNIGTPLSEYLLGDEPAEVLVLEVSSFQLMNARSLRPHVAVLTNFAPNHLDWHADMEEYLQAKLKLFARQTEEDLAVAPLELKDLLEARAFTKARRVYFVASERFPGTRLLGRHNRANLEAAWLAVRPFGVAEDIARAAAESFEPLPHRLSPVGEAGGVLFVDDSKATTLDAVAAAITALEQPIRLLMGGVFKGGDPEILIPLMQGRVREVGLFGASREIFEKAFQGRVPCFWEPTLEAAARKAFAHAEPGEAVLLSPATSSFDLYADYKARGNDFQRVARLLAEERA